MSHGRPYAGQVKPFNFLLAIHLAPFGLPQGVDATRFQLVAPFETNRRRWLQGSWYTLYPCRRQVAGGWEEQLPAGSVFRVSTRQASEQVDENSAIARTYGDVLEEYRFHPEAKFDASDRSVSGPRTTGLLRRRAVWTSADLVRLIGKESNRLEDVEVGLVHDRSEVVTEYPDPAVDQWVVTVAPALKLLPSVEVAAASGISVRSMNRAKLRKQLPRTQVALRQAIGSLESAVGARKCVVCGAELDGDPRRRYCSIGCRS